MNDGIRKTIIEYFSDFGALYTGFRVKLLKKRADKLSKQIKSHVFIIKYRGRIRLVSKRQFKYMRQHGMFPKTFTADKLKKIAYYHTC